MIPAMISNHLLPLQDCTETDYEPWSGPKPEMCQLGRNHTWSRVKPDVDCFNGKGWRGTVLDVTPCFCNHVSAAGY